MIRKCIETDLGVIYEIINDAAQAYGGVIPEDCWHEPYMSLSELKAEIEASVVFWGLEEDGRLIGVMGIQDRVDVDLIRHAYVRPGSRRQGVGTQLLRYLEAISDKPILIGTWAAAGWAIAFYRKNGYRLLPDLEKNRLLRKYWSVPDRQVELSVVLASSKWRQGG
jgi:GNAT superfamily N-acetyltransferase